MRPNRCLSQVKPSQCAAVEPDVGDASAQLPVKYHVEFTTLPSLSVTPFSPPSYSAILPLPPSPPSLSLLPRLMAVEDELRGGPIIEPKTRIFADQVCETVSPPVESSALALCCPTSLSVFPSLPAPLSSSLLQL